MTAIIELPTVVTEALAELGDRFVDEPERRHLAEYLAGLFVAQRKNISTINRQFVTTTDHSCLNRWLTEVQWDVEQLSRRRLNWFFTQRIRVDGVDHPVRIVILWNRWNGKTARKIVVSNRTHWEIGRILHVYRHRWRGTECFHWDGKQYYLGMGDCQLRKGCGQTRHMYRVFLAHSVLMRRLRQHRSRAWALERLTTIGKACRALLRETLRETIDWVIDRVRDDGWNGRQIKAHSVLSMIFQWLNFSLA